MPYENGGSSDEAVHLAGLIQIFLFIYQSTQKGRIR